MSAGTSSALPTATYAGYDNAGNNASLWVPVGGGPVDGNLTVTGDLSVAGVSTFNDAVIVETGGGDSVTIEDVAGDPTIVLNSAANSARIALNPSNIMTVSGVLTDPLMNFPGGVVSPSVSGPSSTSPSFPFGLTSIGNLAGVNATRNRVVNYTNAITDQTILWAGSTYYVNALIQGNGNNFSINVVLPADIATNPAYRGMMIFKMNILMLSISDRIVNIFIKNSSLATILPGTLTAGGKWNVECYLGAPGDVNNPLGLYLTYQLSTNMQAI